MGRSKAPKGHLTAAQAIKRLSVPRSTFYDMVERGQITKIVPPNQSDGFYSEKEINKMARERELFVLTYSQSPSEFSKAEKEDIMGIYEVCTSLWKDRTPKYEARLNSYKQNPSIYYVSKKEGIVVGFLGVIPFTKEALDKVMNEAQTTFYVTYEKVLEESDSILPFRPGEAIESLFLDMAVRQDVPNHKQYGMRLLQGFMSVLEELAEQNIMVKKLHATSSSPDGIGLCRSMKFTELPKLGDSTRLRFELDLEKSDLPILKEYQSTIKMIQSKKAVDIPA